MDEHDDEIYGFGPREGRLVDSLYEGFIQFARHHDISFAEMLGLIGICQKLMTDDMVVRYDNEADHMLPDDDLEIPPSE